MKLETIILIAAAGVAGYALATKKKSAPATKPAPAAALPTATPSVVIEEYDIYDYGPGWGYGAPYPRPWGGAWGGGGRHHHRGGHR